MYISDVIIALELFWCTPFQYLLTLEGKKTFTTITQFSQFADVLVSVCTYLFHSSDYFRSLEKTRANLTKFDRSILKDSKYCHFVASDWRSSLHCTYCDFVLTVCPYTWGKVCSLDSPVLYLHNIPLRRGCWLTHRLLLCPCVVLSICLRFSLARNSNFNSTWV